MVFILEGLPYFIFPHKIKDYLSMLLGMPDSTLRFMGILAIVTGLFLLYFGKT
jgi:hypothetical protein